MNKFFTGILVFMISYTFGQDINQSDQNGKQHGIWKKNFDGTNVLRFEGQFHHGREIGLFKFYQNLGNKAVLAATREFLDGNKANVKFYASNGKLISEGQMYGKTYVGEWRYYQKDSDLLLNLEHFDAQGNLTGERLVYYNNGQISQKENYKNGKLNGKSTWYSENNVIIHEYTYKDGLLHGPARIYDSEGVLVTEGLYDNDQKSGAWKFYENGELKEEKTNISTPK